MDKKRKDIKSGKYEKTYKGVDDRKWEYRNLVGHWSMRMLVENLKSQRSFSTINLSPKKRSYIPKNQDK